MGEGCGRQKGRRWRHEMDKRKEQRHIPLNSKPLFPPVMNVKHGVWKYDTKCGQVDWVVPITDHAARSFLWWWWCLAAGQKGLDLLWNQNDNCHLYYSLPLSHTNSMHAPTLFLQDQFNIILFSTSRLSFCFSDHSFVSVSHLFLQPTHWVITDQAEPINMWTRKVLSRDKLSHAPCGWDVGCRACVDVTRAPVSSGSRSPTGHVTSCSITGSGSLSITHF